MVTHSGPFPAGSPASAALGASENGHYVACALDCAPRALEYYAEALGLAEAERYLTLAQDLCARAGPDPDTLVLLPFLG